MKQIIELSRRELFSIFCSPIGWITSIIFLVQFIFIVFGRIDTSIWILENRDIDTNYYTNYFFSTFGATFGNITTYFYLYIPLLTMGLLSREYNEGGIKLLFSSPIRTHEIVCGKYLAIIIFIIFMLSVIGIAIGVIRLFVIDRMDLVLVLNGLFVMFLVMSLYASIGLFISSLTSYQLASAVGTFAVLFILNTYVDTLVQSHHPEIFQLLASVWLPPRGHTDGLSGLLNSSDILYFLFLSGLFLALTYLRLHFMRNASTILYRVSILSGLVLVILGLGLYTYSPSKFLYIDMTEPRIFTPSSEQQEFMSNFGEPFIFTRYVNVLSAPTAGAIPGLFGRIGIVNQIQKRTKFRPDIQYIPYYNHTDALHMSLIYEDSTFSDAAVLSMQTSRRLNRTSEDLDITELAKYASEKYSWFDYDDLIKPSELAQQSKLPIQELGSFYLVNSGNISTTLLRGGGAPSDQIFTTTLKRLIDGPSYIGFTTGNEERDPNGTDDFGYLRIFNHKIAEHSLPNLGFEIVLLDVNESIPDSINILVIAEPTSQFSASQLINLQEYIESGGNLLLITSNDHYTNVKPVATMLGLSFGSTEFPVDKYPSINANVVRKTNSPESGLLENHVLKYYNLTATLMDKYGVGHKVTIPNPATIVISDDSKFEYHPIILDDEKVLMIGLSRHINGAEQRIIVSGDADFLSNSVEGIGHFSQFRRYPANHALAASMFRWLSNDEYPALVDRDEQLERLKITNSTLLKYGMLILLPLPLIIFAMVIVIKRMKK